MVNMVGLVKYMANWESPGWICNPFNKLKYTSTYLPFGVIMYMLGGLKGNSRGNTSFP